MSGKPISTRERERESRGGGRKRVCQRVQGGVRWESETEHGGEETEDMREREHGGKETEDIGENEREHEGEETERK